MRFSSPPFPSKNDSVLVTSIYLILLFTHQAHAWDSGTSIPPEGGNRPSVHQAGKGNQRVKNKKTAIKAASQKTECENSSFWRCRFLHLQWSLLFWPWLAGGDGPPKASHRNRPEPAARVHYSQVGFGEKMNTCKGSVHSKNDFLPTHMWK